MRLYKEQVAVRQLDTAIELLFGLGDIVSIHTLTSAASNIFADMLKASGEKAWAEEIASCFPGEEKQAKAILRRAQNFFKHADRDAEETLSFDEVENDEAIVVATLEYGRLIRTKKRNGQVVSLPMSVFQMWYFAKQPEVLLLSGKAMGRQFVEASQQLFPDLEKRPRFEQLTLGQRALKKAESGRPVRASNQ